MDKKLLFYDIETIWSYFLISILDGETWIDFSINQYTNDLYNLIKYLENNKNSLWIGYNNLGFDGQVIEFIYREYESWHLLSSLEISQIIWQKAQDIIDDSNHGLFPPYREYLLTFKQLDVFKIQHFDNKNRMVGLKRLEYEMSMPDIEDMPVPHTKSNFSEQEVLDLIYYCHNDVKATKLNYLHLTGEVDHEIYRENNQIELREALTDIFKINCTNYSNSKYGDEIIKLLYCKEAGIKYRDLPKKGTFRKSIKLSNCIPEHIEFQTEQLNKFLKSVKRKTLSVSEKFEEVVSFKGQEYTFARGGLHNKIKYKSYSSTDEYVIIDADVSSYYVATILNNNDAPAHLNKKAFNKAYRWIYDERIRLKPLSKLDKKIKGVVSGYKEAGVSVYGKSGDMTNWLYDPEMMLRTCISGEFSILMLIEAQELSGSSCIMANTDGATFLVKRSEIDNFYEICNSWCKKTNYLLEFFEFKNLWFLGVNSYLGVKSDGEIKRKGDFLIDTELHKKKTYRVIPLALSEYFINNKDPEEFINNHSNIYDFCDRSSAGKTYKHMSGDTQLPKLIRYYVAKKGDKIMKIVRENNTTNAKNTNLEPSEYPKKVINKVVYPQRELDNLDRSWYLDKVREIIFKIERGRDPRREDLNINQITLF